MLSVFAEICVSCYIYIHMYMGNTYILLGKTSFGDRQDFSRGNIYIYIDIAYKYIYIYKLQNIPSHYFL